MNLYVMEILLQEKRREMAAEAERLRMISEYSRNRPTVSEKMLKKLGEWLITLGKKLVHRHDHKTEAPSA